nr:hypothetical protein [Fibrobacterota bacterium]
MKLSLRIVLSEIVPVLLILAMVSAGTAQAGSNRRVSWNTYETRNFKIVWHQDVKPQADIAKDFLEEAHARIGKDLGLRDRGIPITVVLTGLPDESNGYATPLGHRIVIFTRPGQVLATGEIAWLKRVLAHELTHQLTFLALRKSFLGIYSELYKTSHLPSWFVEGVAQFEAETWDAKRNTFFAHALYNSALEPYPNLATYTKADPVSSRLVYEQGHAFVRFLMAKEGRGFLGPLLKRIRVIPVWSELKALLSPFTGSMLPLESALRAKTGLSYKVLYREFLDSMQAGLPKGYRLPGEPLAGGVPGFAIIFQSKRIDSASFLFTGQKKWDQPYVSLFLSRSGKVERIGPSYVNPVFDLSEDGKRLLYVRTYTDRDRDPVDKLFLRDLETGTDRLVSDGAAHPIFLGPDSIAFSRYQKGRQTLVLCSLPGVDPACVEVAQDSIVAVYGLSRSARGILCNATDALGRTGIHEYSAGTGFTRLFQDTVPSEFPVEADDGSVWMIRERGGLMQVDSWNRLTGVFSSVADFPLGTFYLHRAAPGVIASVAQTGSQGNWGFMPVKLRTPTPTPIPSPDSVYVAPGFLSKSSPALITGDPPPVQATVSRYHSLLEMRPLILYPTLVLDFPLTNFSVGALLEDPLELHSLSVNLAWLSEVPGYDVDYT